MRNVHFACGIITILLPSLLLFYHCCPSSSIIFLSIHPPYRTIQSNVVVKTVRSFILLSPPSKNRIYTARKDTGFLGKCFGLCFFFYMRFSIVSVLSLHRLIACGSEQRYNFVQCTIALYMVPGLFQTYARSVA